MRIEVEVVGIDKASTVFGKVGGAVSGLGSIAAKAATGGLALAGTAVVGLGAAAVGAAVGVTKLAMAAAEIEGTRRTFETLTRDLGGSARAMDMLRSSTRGMVSQADVMAASNKFLTMGITENIEETAKMAEMATQLGLAMGQDATKAMEDFALMMANQSIPRLDTFGISSSVVRARILELQAATEGLSREEAFKIAVMEQGAVAMEKVGEQGESAAATTLRWRTAIEDLKLSVGRAFIPALEALRKPIMELVDEHGPKVVEWAEIAGAWLGENLPIAIEKLEEIWTGLQPAIIWLSDKFELFTTSALPQLEAAWDDLRVGLQDVSSLVDTELKPALDELWLTLGIGTEEVDGLVAGFGWLFGGAARLLTADLLGRLRRDIEGLTAVTKWATRAFDNIRGSIDRVEMAFQNFKNAVRGFELPWWLSPGSPTPLETGLLGIADALGAVQGMAGGGLGIGFPGGGRGGDDNRIDNRSWNMQIRTNAEGRQAVRQGFQTLAALA